MFCRHYAVWIKKEFYRGRIQRQRKFFFSVMRTPIRILTLIQFHAHRGKLLIIISRRQTKNPYCEKFFIRFSMASLSKSGDPSHPSESTKPDSNRTSYVHHGTYLHTNQNIHKQ